MTKRNEFDAFMARVWSPVDLAVTPRDLGAGLKPPSDGVVHVHVRGKNTAKFIASPEFDEMVRAACDALRKEIAARRKREP